MKLQQICDYFLKKFNAKVVPLANLRSCPRFENMPNADMCSETSSERNKFKNIFFSFGGGVGLGSVGEELHLFLFPLFFSVLKEGSLLIRHHSKKEKRRDLVIANLVQ